MNFEKYSAFTLQDFLADDDFVQWVLHPALANDAFWQSFITAYTHQKEVVEHAAAIILRYRAQDTFYNDSHKDLVWQRIAGSIATEPVASPQRKIAGLPVKGFLRVAAILLLAAGLSFWMLSRNTASEKLSFSTAFAEVKTIVLPDQSQVTLNGNSSISYAKQWNKSTPREVWIRGEGYFNVKHLNTDTAHILPAETFTVYCGDVNIEVLGTTFNVKARHGKTNVALITGKIRIDYTDSAAGNKPVVMAPGDYIEYASKKLLINKRLAKPTLVTVWKTNEISFTDATLKEIIETLQDNYGYAVEVKDSSLLTLKIEGDISVNNIADLLDVVGTTLNITIEQPTAKHITITK